MKVVLFTADEPMYMPRYLEPLVRNHAEKLTEVVLAPVPGEDLRTTIRRRYRMFGPTAFVRYGIRFGLGKFVSAFPSSSVRTLTGRYYSVTDLAEDYGIPVRTEMDVNRAAFVSHLRDVDPDLILSISCGQRLGSELLSLPEKGCINLHGSLLPKYQGRATAFWVLYFDEEESGVTAHYMTNEFDAGDIVMQRRFPVEDGDTMDDVYEKVVDVGSRMAVDLVERLTSGETPSTTPNPTAEGEYRSLPGPRERRKFEQKGNEFL